MAFSFKHAVNAAFLGLLFAASQGFAGDTPSNEVEVGADQIQQYLVSAFPREYKALGGLFTLTARNPELSIPRGGNRLLMAFDASWPVSLLLIGYALLAWIALRSLPSNPTHSTKAGATDVND